MARSRNNHNNFLKGYRALLRRVEKRPCFYGSEVYDKLHIISIRMLAVANAPHNDLEFLVQLLETNTRYHALIKKRIECGKIGE